MTDEKIKTLDHYQVWDIFNARGICSTYRPDVDGCPVWVTMKDGTNRLANDEETKLHVQANDSYLREEAAAGLI